MYNFTLIVNRSIITGIIGPSGSGKTTLLRNIAGIVTPTNGNIKFDKKKINPVPVAKRPISYLQQSFPLYERLTVMENILVSYKKVQKKDIEKTKNLLNEFFIKEEQWNRVPLNLSGGERQRIALIKAMMKPADILLLDEPFSNLDKNLKNKASAILINHIRENNKICLYVTHDESEVILNSDKLVVLEDGKLIQEGTPEELVNQPYNSNIASLGNPLGLQSIEVSMLPDNTNLHYPNSVKKLAWHPHKSKLVDYSHKETVTSDIMLPMQIEQIKKSANRVLYALKPLNGKADHLLLWHEFYGMNYNYTKNQKVTLRVAKEDIIKLDENNKVVN
ncbi:MAG: ABC transporter ATP-binding protein [Bacteroidales bacterium]|nr:ABC transporter ATP-binding protein [Bacteroidales bacterium]